MSETIIIPPNVIREEMILPYHIPPGSETILDIGGGYVGATEPGIGYGDVNTVNAPNLPLVTQFGNFIQNNPMIALGLGIGAILLLGKGRR